MCGIGEQVPDCAQPGPRRLREQHWRSCGSSHPYTSPHTFCPTTTTISPAPPSSPSGPPPPTRQTCLPPTPTRQTRLPPTSPEHHRRLRLQDQRRHHHQHHHPVSGNARGPSIKRPSRCGDHREPRFIYSGTPRYQKRGDDKNPMSVPLAGRLKPTGSCMTEVTRTEVNAPGRA